MHSPYRRTTRRSKKFLIVSMILVLIVAIAVLLSNSGAIGALRDIGRVREPSDPRVVSVEMPDSRPEGFWERIGSALFGTSRTSSVRADAWIDGEIAIHGLLVEIFDEDRKVAEIRTGSGETFDALYRRQYRAMLTYAGDDVIAPARESIPFLLEEPGAALNFTVAAMPSVTKYRSDGKGGVRVLERVLDVPYLSMMPELPTGDAITAMTALLRYWQIDVGKTALASRLRKEDFYWKNRKLHGADPQVAFSGNPTDSQGWIVYERPVINAAREYLRSIARTDLAVEAMKDPTEEKIIEELSAGRPVVVWQTEDLTPARYDYQWILSTTGEVFDAPVNLRVTVVHGYDDRIFHVMNPAEGSVQYDRTELMESIQSMGSRVIRVFRE